eukprot:gene11898-biopygen7540
MASPRMASPRKGHRNRRSGGVDTIQEFSPNRQQQPEPMLPQKTEYM